MKFLITNADDYGYRIDVSRGIIDCHKSENLTSTTVLVNFISSEEVTLANSNPNLGLGLHINLADGSPVSENWKKKYGDFTHPRRNENAVYEQSEWENLFSNVSKSDIYEEVASQYKKFLEIFDKKPTHLDTHYFTSGITFVFDAFLSLAKENSLPVRHPMVFRKETSLLSAEVEVNHDQLKKLRQEGIKTVDYYSPESLILCPDPFKAIEDEIAKVDEGQAIEISFHPGYGDKWREDYNNILLDAKFANIIKDNNIKLINYAKFSNASEL